MMTKCILKHKLAREMPLEHQVVADSSHDCYAPFHYLGCCSRFTVSPLLENSVASYEDNPAFIFLAQLIDSLSQQIEHQSVAQLYIVHADTSEADVESRAVHPRRVGNNDTIDF
ncbi:UNVERIFIED_CONTAM: hypothetical protein NY100_09285 [Prevotella sp. 15_C9]